MNNIIESFINSKQISNKEDFINSLREVLQNIILIGLKNGGFFEKGAFYGGTALRIFYGLNRYSEDLDFTLFKNDSNFSFDSYFSYIQKIANSYGFEVEFSAKEKEDSNIVSAFLKTETNITFINFHLPESFNLNKSEKLKIKFEVDVKPATNFNIESKLLMFPEYINITVLDMPSLFAAKIHAILCRNYANRVKGRDYYDYLYFVNQNTKINYDYLKEKLLQSNYNIDYNKFDLQTIKELLKKKFEEVDIEQLKQDLIPFIDSNSNLEIDSQVLIDSLNLLKD